MSDSDFIMWNKDGEWLTAPYNEGAGGVFTADTETLEYFSLYIEEHGIEVDKTDYFLFLNYEQIIPLQHLAPKKRKCDKHQFQIRINDQWISCNPPDLSEPEQDALAVDKNAKISYTQDDTPSLVWLNEGGREQWRQNRARKKIEEEQRKLTRQERLAAEAAKKLHDQGDHFINPYTFVPLPDQIKRSNPLGHEALKPNSLSGWFTWQLTFATPLVYPAEGLPITKNGHMRYPGSALRGALRNLHEALTGSCMRTLDDEYLPVHREPMSVGAKKHRLAVVREVDPVTGAITKVEPTDELCWVESSVIHEAIRKNKLHSGCHVNLDTSSAQTIEKLNRTQITNPGAASKGNDWVLHLSDGGARTRAKKYFIAAGRLTNKEYLPITRETWMQFKQMCDGSQDLIGENNNADDSSKTPESSTWIKVEYEGKTIGRRHRTDGYLSVGDTVWLDASGRLKMATIWRYPGEYSVGDRMNKDFKPCHDPEHLCPSCAVFGSVDTRTLGEKSKGAGEDSSVEQAGYASHVRVGWGYCVTDPSLPPRKEVDIAPLRSPKPSSGGFYLIPSDKPGLASTKDNHIPHAHWGSNSDKPEPRMIRGRKYYWHGQTDRGASNHQAKRVDVADNDKAYISQEGLILKTRVSFDNLSREQLGWLLAAADPTTFYQSDCQVHIGRGKPLGYGSAEPQVTDLHAQTATNRYTQASNSHEASVEEYISTVRGDIPEELHTVHAALQRVLSSKPENVAADRISYPTTENFKDKDTKRFKESFRWFTNNSGGRKGRLRPLPMVDDDQYIPSQGSDQEGEGKTK